MILHTREQFVDILVRSFREFEVATGVVASVVVMKLWKVEYSWSQTKSGADRGISQVFKLLQSGSHHG